MRVFINGKFLGARRTGVQRVAFEMTKALDLLSAKDTADGIAARLVLSRLGTKATDFDLRSIPLKSFKGLPPIAWEQVYFPWQTRKDFALNMCNSGSFLSRRAVTVIHDAQVYSSPQSYSKPFRLWYKFLLPLMGRRHAHIVTVSNYSKAQLVQYGVASADKISVIHNGADHILSVPSTPSILDGLSLQKHGYVLALSTTQNHKNIRVLIDAFEDPSLKGVKLVLFGKATREDFQQALGRAISDAVVFAGKVDDAELRALMENAMCLGFPSTTEGFGLPVLEAMLLGCPAVVAPAGALPEVCGNAVIYADPNGPADWISAFNQLSKSPQWRQSMSEASIAQASQFTWARAAEKLICVLKEHVK